MPNLDLIPVPQYDPNQPYFWTYDNLPLAALAQRDVAINNVVNYNSEILRQSVGTAGTLSARLSQSLLDNGDLKSEAVDKSLHNIGYHFDGFYEGVEYVRMKLEERQKLELIQPEAKNLQLAFTGISDIVYIDSGVGIFDPSDTITWSVSADQKIQANVTVGLTNAHRHYDNIVPQPTATTPDYKNYITGLASAYSSGSLKVFVNGVRLSPDFTVYVPSRSTNPTWSLNKFSESTNKKGFILQNAITADDIIFIDFEVPLG